MRPHKKTQKAAHNTLPYVSHNFFFVAFYSRTWLVITSRPQMVGVAFKSS